MANVTMTTCTTCKGKGAFTEIHEDIHRNPAEETFICSSCNGAGYEFLTDEEIEYRKVAKELRNEQRKNEKGIQVDLSDLFE
ncbi:hypothetical protein SAMN04487944_10263 [Gracilibacillus ureilyticus]|uniref:Uncharacterized protein n=1 Tax=Gracilibacillus ureilyticus TaxID=531814 RepID=A0A1H9MNC2_9BACI|nr:hypothetical protein [Gracilibacillus ureilyticus]SER24935.1 hypothetical protein SAMN04487944_10263 [Gracilibacillus ureilyticus]